MSEANETNQTKNDVIARLQALEILLIEVRKEVDNLKNTLQKEFDYINFQ
jgi:hypothetical protein